MPRARDVCPNITVILSPAYSHTRIYSVPSLLVMRARVLKRGQNEKGRIFTIKNTGPRVNNDDAETPCVRTYGEKYTEPDEKQNKKTTTVMIAKIIK